MFADCDPPIQSEENAAASPLRHAISTHKISFGQRTEMILNARCFSLEPP